MIGNFLFAKKFHIVDLCAVSLITHYFLSPMVMRLIED